jgi:hypothetical protein
LTIFDQFTAGGEQVPKPLVSEDTPLSMEVLTDAEVFSVYPTVILLPTFCPDGQRPLALLSMKPDRFCYRDGN